MRLVVQYMSIIEELCPPAEVLEVSIRNLHGIQTHNWSFSTLGSACFCLEEKEQEGSLTEGGALYTYGLPGPTPSRISPTCSTDQ